MSNVLRFAVILGVLLVGADFLYDKVAHLPGEALPGFHGVLGAAVAVVLMALGTAVRRSLGRGEDYYGA